MNSHDMEYDEHDDEELPLDEADDDDLEAVDPALLLRERMPMFQALFLDAVAGDAVLEDFGEHVVGELSDRFALKAAKGGAFFQERTAEGMQGTVRYKRDQTLRAHLINGMLPALRVARLLAEWAAPAFQDWDETSERLFIAGYMLHDYSKIEDVEKALVAKEFKKGEAPSERQIPVLEDIFREWCANLGLDVFLAPVGGPERYLHDLIYIAANTQRLKGTIHAPRLLPRQTLDIDKRNPITWVSRMADLIAYIAPTPRDVVAHQTIRKLFAEDLAFDETLQQPVARLVYHHVAENRGLLLNFIHNAAMDALVSDLRVPLLYAPSGVVYLERYDAPAMPEVDELVVQVIENIRQIAGERSIAKGVGIQLNKDGLRFNDIFYDLFGLRETVRNSYKLVLQIRSNAPQYMEFLEKSDWPHTDALPTTTEDKNDTRLRQMAEWASLLEIQFEERAPNLVNPYIDFVFDSWGIHDMRPNYEDLRTYQQRGTGVRHRWYWAAAHALERQAGIKPDDVIAALKQFSEQLAQDLPQELPDSADANQETWDDLKNYTKSVLTVQGGRSQTNTLADELERYVRAKAPRSQPVCALCGDSYSVRKQLANTVAFQPGVYTQRLAIGARENKRHVCSICGFEQLLRQLFIDVENMTTGSKAENQRIRYLSFYPSYFFSPETLTIVKRAYDAVKAVRLSDSELWRALRNQDALDDVAFWQRVDAFLLRPEGEIDESKFQRVLRYGSTAQATFFTVGFRNLEPTETESWVLPAFLALVMAVNLDVKVVASDSGVPLMLEAADLPETLWFDGVHSALQGIMQHTRPHIDQIRDDKMLARLVAAYLIHLDTEYDPPKEHWQRFGPIANALCESPLYVFHYLKKQEREDEKHKAMTPAKIKRYIYYAEDLFNPQGDVMLDHARELAQLYYQFYKVNEAYRASSYTLLRPLNIVADAVLEANPDLFPSEEALIGLTRGQLKDRLDSSETKAFVDHSRQEEMKLFCEKFVKDIFIGVFKTDTAALRGKQLSLLRSACEVYYIDAVREGWAKYKAETATKDDN